MSGGSKWSISPGRPGQLVEVDSIPANPKQIYGDRKVPLQLVPPAASIAIAMGLAEGAEKYGPWNWRASNVEVMTYYGAIQRHLAAWLEGEYTDPDGSGKSHLAGAIASLAILIDATECGTAVDNRPGISNGTVKEALALGKRNG